MRALTIRTGAAAPALTDVTPAPLGSGDLRIAVEAAAINPVDLFVSTGLARDVFDLPDHVGLGWDVGGTVTEVGAEVSGFAPGDRVAAAHADMTAPSRAHAESIVVAATAAARVPDDLDLRSAATVPLNALTARQALDLLGPAEGRTLLVTGAAGAVGGYAVALAAREGWQVTALARSTDATFVKEAGAVDLLTELPGPIFDAVLDAAALQGTALEAVRDAGSFVGVQPAAPLSPVRGIGVQAVGIRPDGATLADLLRLAADGTLATRIAGTAPLAEAVETYAKVAGGGQRGRWLLLP